MDAYNSPILLLGIFPGQTCTHAPELFIPVFSGGGKLETTCNKLTEKVVRKRLEQDTV